jgi:hypothetical protein
MHPLTRRDLLKSAGFLLAAQSSPDLSWICEGYHAPFYFRAYPAESGWLDVLVPRLFIHEAVRVDLA